MGGYLERALAGKKSMCRHLVVKWLSVAILIDPDKNIIRLYKIACNKHKHKKKKLWVHMAFIELGKLWLILPWL